MIVATAGHVDHGKTTLVKALSGVDTDRLPEEKARGISIDLGFAYWTPVAGVSIGFVDVPGHERFIRNMLAGVCGIDFVMLIVAADDGVMPQTVEHLHIVDLLKVIQGAVVVTKIDRVGPDRVRDVVEDVRSLLHGTALASIPVLSASAVTGEGIDTLRDVLARAATAHDRREQVARHFRYAIDRAFTMAGSGTVVTGTVFNGAVAMGDRLVISPSGHEVRVRALQKQGRQAPQAMAGERCALNLSGVDLKQVGRGDWLVSHALHAPTQRIDVRLQVLSSESDPIKHWTPVLLHHGTAGVGARVAIKRGGTVLPGTSAVVQLIVDRPLSVFHGDRFIVRDQSALRTIGGGSVIDPFAPMTGRYTPERAARLLALEQAEPAAALSALLACSAAGVDIAQFERAFNLKHEHVADLAARAGATIVGKDVPVGLLRKLVDSIKEQVPQMLARFHREFPQSRGAETETVRKTIAPNLGVATFTAMLRELANERLLELTGSSVRSVKHVSTANPADELLWQKVKPVLDNAGFNVPTLRELALAAALKESTLTDFLHRKSRTAEVIRVTPERFYPRETLSRLAAIVRSTAQANADGQFTAAQFRDGCGLGRTLAIEMLECFDRLGITQRVGNTRKMIRDFDAAPGAGASPSTVESASPDNRRK